MIPIVYVHLGPSTPEWLLWNISRSRKLFSNEIVLISDNLALLRLAEKRNANVFFWDSRLWFKKLADIHASHSAFWQGFWIYTGLRFLALSAFHNTRPQLPLLHSESDVLLHPLFGTSWVAPIGERLAGSRLSLDRTGGALVYSPNASMTDRLKREIVIWFEQNSPTNEMLALENFRRRFPDFWCDLPTVDSPDPSFFQSGIPALTRRELCANASLFSGLFDVAGIGQYLFGSDARMSRGFSKVRHSFKDQFLDVSNWTFKVDSHGWPLVSRLDFDISLFSLHIHSKNKIFFEDSFHSPRVQKLIKNYHLSPNEVFSFWAFREILKNRLIK